MLRYSLFLVLLFLFFLIACAEQLEIKSQEVINKKNEKLSIQKPTLVAATIYPIYSIAQQIGGDKIKVKLIISPGESPHTFNPKISTKINIKNSERIFYIGNDLDDWVLSLLDDKSKAVIVDKNIVKLTRNQNSHDEHEGIDRDFNPHYWLSPFNSKLIANTITSEYVLIDPANEGYYQHQLKSFNSEIDELYEKLLNEIKYIDKESFITFHDAWDYFCDAFGLNIIGTFEPVGAEEPTPKYLKDLQDKIDKNKVKILFSEPQLSTLSLDAFIKDNGLTISIIDPIGGIEGRMSYQKLISYNVQIMINSINDSKNSTQ